MLTQHTPPAPPGHQRATPPPPLRIASPSSADTINTVVTPSSPKVPLDSLELLHQRHADGHHSHGGTHSPQVGAFTVSSGASAKTPRRKSQLAAEWERKFGGAN